MSPMLASAITIQVLFRHSTYAFVVYFLHLRRKKFKKAKTMKLSKYFYVTLRETPSDATMPSHIFLMRGGYIKPVSTGIYSMMPMGFRVIQKIVNIIREEMNKIGGIEVDLPVVQTAELWSESGRYQAIGEELLRFKDRNNHNMVLAMTHEEAMTDLVRYVLNSYKQLPVMLYQFKTKYRDEARARGGLIRPYPRPRIPDEGCLQLPHQSGRPRPSLPGRIRRLPAHLPSRGH